jgi:RNA polymerase primary sigma factor
MSSVRRSRPSFESDVLSTYFREIGAYRLLSREEELALGRRIHAGDESAVGELVCANLRFVISIAKRYQNQGVSLSDLINEGNVGLMRAARKYDEAKGVKFISYAVWWIRQAIVQALSEYAHTVRIPVGRVAMLHRITVVTNALRQELGREPSRQEVAASLDMAMDDLVKAIPIGQAELSLDAPLVDNEEGRLLDILADDDSSSPDEDVGGGDLSSSIDEALSHLRDREGRVLRLYFGLDGNEPMTLEEIGDELGVTRERVRQIKERALGKLRRSSTAIQLESFTHA